MGEQDREDDVTVWWPEKATFNSLGIAQKSPVSFFR